MSEISTQVIFSKEKFIFGEDTIIDGTILLTGVDRETISNIHLNHYIRYGISYSKENPFEGFDYSEEKTIYSGDISLLNLTFSIPLVYPNIKKTDGASLIDGYSLVQNVLCISMNQKSFSLLGDPSQEFIVPIEWPALGNDAINNSDFRDQLEIPYNEDDVVCEEVINTKLPYGYGLLPWKEESDFVSEEFYAEKMAKYPLAKLGDMIYNNFIFQILRGGAALSGIVGMLLFLILGGNFSSNPNISLVLGGNFTHYADISMLIILASVAYLLLQQIPIKYLKEKMTTYKYLPDITPKKQLSGVLSSDTLNIKDIFQDLQFSSDNPILHERGTLSIRLMLSHKFTFKSGKDSSYHDQVIIDGTLPDVPFVSLPGILDKQIILPKWIHEMLSIPGGDKIGFTKDLCLYITFDNLPDKDYIVEL